LLYYSVPVSARNLPDIFKDFPGLINKFKDFPPGQQKKIQDFSRMWQPW